MSDLKTFEAISIAEWQQACDAPLDSPMPKVLYLPRKPRSVERSGGYLRLKEFLSIVDDRTFSGYLSLTPAVGLFHGLVLHTIRVNYPEFYDETYADLRYVPWNHSSSSPYASSHNYSLLKASLGVYAYEPLAPEHKIVGFGKKGREILRSCLEVQANL